jgi:hypothetical protein
MEQKEDNCRHRKMHRLRNPLGYAAVRHANPRLVSAAEAYFGTWGNALYAARIDPNLYLRGKWRTKNDRQERSNSIRQPI